MNGYIDPRVTIAHKVSSAPSSKCIQNLGEMVLRSVSNLLEAETFVKSR